MQRIDVALRRPRVAEVEEVRALELVGLRKVRIHRSVKSSVREVREKRALVRDMHHVVLATVDLGLVVAAALRCQVAEDGLVTRPFQPQDELMPLGVGEVGVSGAAATASQEVVAQVAAATVGGEAVDDVLLRVGRLAGARRRGRRSARSRG